VLFGKFAAVRADGGLTVPVSPAKERLEVAGEGKDLG